MYCITRQRNIQYGPLLNQKTRIMRIISTLFRNTLLISFLFTLFLACGKDDAPSQGKEQPVPEETVPEETVPEETTPEETEPEISNEFSNGPDGWTVRGDAGGVYVVPEYSEDGGVQNGYIYAIDEVTGGVWYFVAPKSYNGNRSDAYGKSLSFSLKQSGLNDQFDRPDAPDIILEGPNFNVVFDTENHPGTDWTDYKVEISAEAGWTINTTDGENATEAQIKEVLANLLSFRIRGEFITGPDTGSLDNPYFPGVFNKEEEAEKIEKSEFIDDVDGWTIWGDAGGVNVVPEFSPDGGVQNGYIYAVDNVTGGVWYFVAPKSFLGDRSTGYGKELSFNLKQSRIDSQFHNVPDIILEGADFNIVFNTQDNPGTDWTDYAVEISADAGWTINTIDGDLATEAEIKEVLANLKAFKIRGEFRTGEDTGSLDNPYLPGG